MLLPVAESMKPKAEWIANGAAATITHEGQSITIPALYLEDLADDLSRMAYHGYIPHHTAPTGSDYGRKAKDVEDDNE